MYKMIEGLLNTYYSIIIGVEPYKEDYSRTVATTKHLIDNGFSQREIFNIYKEIGKSRIEVKDLPDRLWNTLIDRNQFYYSNILHITSKPPTWNPKTFKEECEPFFMEMVMNFSMENLIQLYYDKCRVPVNLRLKQYNKAEGAFYHLLNRYDTLRAPALDYILLMLNLASEDTDMEFITDVFEIEKYFKEAYEILNKMVDEATFNKTNVIVWRD